MYTNHSQAYIISLSKPQNQESVLSLTVIVIRHQCCTRHRRVHQIKPKERLRWVYMYAQPLTCEISSIQMRKISPRKEKMFYMNHIIIINSKYLYILRQKTQVSRQMNVTHVFKLQNKEGHVFILLVHFS